MKKLALLDFDATLYDSHKLIQEHAELFGKERAPVVRRIANEIVQGPEWTLWKPRVFAEALVWLLVRYFLLLHSFCECDTTDPTIEAY